MCGLFGITRFKSDNELSSARASLHKLQHRGPDQWGDYFDESVYLGHRRLSILDLSEQGRQPMQSRDGSVIITVNGEIYNFRELRQELSHEFEFTSSSDSEVVLHGYKKWGIEGLLDRLDGMYAFSVYDKEDQLFYLARDRAGIKPLLYANFKGRLIYASELKSIEHFLGPSNLETDYTALYDFLTYRYIPAPKTMYKDVYKLEPAHFLRMDLSDGSLSVNRYWQLETGGCNDSIEVASRKISQLIKESVSEQMVSDVPVGFFLSGGMDSSSIVALASDLNASISTFAIGFSEKGHDETGYADLVAEKYETIHYKKVLDASRTADMFGRIKEWYDEPFADTSCFPTFMVSEFAKESVTVALTGDGGDEIFGGYTWFSDFRDLTRFNLPLLSPLKKIFDPFRNRSRFTNRIIKMLEHPWLYTDMEMYTRLKSGMLAQGKKSYRRKWGIPDDYDDYWYFRKYYREDLDVITRLQFMEFHTYLPDDILTKVDRVSMAVSLECRVPLLSRKLIEYLFSLPTETRLHNGELKGAMKEAFKGVLPSEILERDKKGFSIPFENWRGAITGGDQNRQVYILNHLFGH